MTREPIRARMIDGNTITHGAVRLTALNPIKSLCEHLVRDGYNPRASLQVWKGAAPWRLVERIGEPDQLLKVRR